MSSELGEKNASFAANTSVTNQQQENLRICQTEEKKEPKKKTRTHFNLYEEWAKLEEEDAATNSSNSSNDNSKDSISFNKPLPKQETEQKVKIKIDSCDLGVSKLQTPAKNFESFTLFTPKQKEDVQPAARVQCSIDVSSYLRSNQKKFSAKNIFKTPQEVKPVVEETVAKQPEEPKIKDFFKLVTVNNMTYIVLNILGKGGSSIVYDCYDPQTKTACAIKCVNLNQDMNCVNSYLNEIKTLVKLQNCSRIIKLHAYQILKEKRRLYVVLEKGGKDLAVILKELASSSTHLPLYMVIYYWMEMLYAVKEIHEKGVIHSDLKPANFLEVKGRIKLIDFGISTCVQNEMTSVIKTVALGTFSYISPEALFNEASTNTDSPNFGKQKFKISYKSDVWSLGCILYQLIYRKTPFQHIMHPLHKYAAITNPSYEIKYPPVDWAPDKILKTIKDCLQYDMRSRPSVDDLIAQYEALYN